MMRRTPRSTLFPCTTLFRSEDSHDHALAVGGGQGHDADVDLVAVDRHRRAAVLGDAPLGDVEVAHDLHARHDAWDHPRSEEHTSELQSRQYLVCRPLLDKIT